MSAYTIRPGSPEEASLVARQRHDMFVDMGRPVEAFDRVSDEFAAWVADRIASGEYQAWFAVDAGGRVVGGAGLWLTSWPPHPVPNRSRRGYVLNVYVSQDHRRRGLARRLMDAVLAACRQAGVGVVTLHSSDEGRPLYESLGFTRSEEMRLVLEDQPANA